jgi:hypothetical protein
VENIAKIFPPVVSKEISHDVSRDTGTVPVASLENE